MSLEQLHDLVALHRATAPASAGVLVCLVPVAGSSHTHAGARLLAVGEGNTAGTLSRGYLGADLLHRGSLLMGDGAVMKEFRAASNEATERLREDEAELLLESAGSAEAGALVAALEASLAGSYAIVATCLPGAEKLARIVIDAEGDVLFASDALPTEDIVDLRRAARCSEHGSRLQLLSYDVFVEHFQRANS